MLVISSIILIVSYIFIAWEKTPKVTIAMLAASLMLIISKAPSTRVFSYVDFQVIFLLISMMIIVHITTRSGVFNWIAIEMLKFTKGRPKLILLALAALTAFLSAFLDNVTTVVLIIPVTFLIAKELDLNPIPFLLTEIFASNIGGTATLIGDPPNIIIGSAAGFAFMDFVKELTPVVLIVFIVSITILIFMFRKQLLSTPDLMQKVQLLDNSHSITDKPLMIISLIVLLAVICGFVFHGIIHIDAYVIALMGASILLLFDSPKHIMNEVEWTTIFFFIGLFIIIGSFAEAGGVKYLANQVIHLTAGDLKKTTMLILWASGVFSSIIDNIPYTVTMAPMINELKHTMEVTPLWWSLSLGACLGGNATIVGAAANVIVIEAALAKGYKISFWQFMKYGVLITFISFVICTAFLYIRFF